MIEKYVIPLLQQQTAKRRSIESFSNNQNTLLVMDEFVAKVLRTAYSEETQDEIQRIAKNITDLMSADPAYVGMMSLVRDLEERNNRFRDLLAASKNGDHIVIHEKNAQHKVVIKSLNGIADQLDQKAEGDTGFIIRAGFKCQKKRTNKERPLGTPEIKDVRHTNLIGQVEVLLQKADNAKMYAFEWSADGGETWHNGQYSTKIRYTLTVKPHSEIAVRVRAIGANDQMSEYSNIKVGRSL